MAIATMTPRADERSRLGELAAVLVRGAGRRGAFGPRQTKAAGAVRPDDDAIAAVRRGPPSPRVLSREALGRRSRDDFCVRA